LIAGTSFKRGAAAQNKLKKLVADHTPARTTFREIHDINVDGKRVLMFEIPPAPPGIPLSEAEFKALKSNNLVEGRRPNIYVSARIAAAAGQEADYVVTAGFDDDYYKDLILKFIDKFDGATPKQIQQALTRKLPGVLSDDQKRNKTRNLVQELARSGVIINAGKHGPGARWVRVKGDA